MGLLKKALEKRSGFENPSTTLLQALSVIRSKANISVNKNNILTLSGVFAAVKVLSETIASLPLIFYMRQDGKRRATDNDLYTLLHDEPNEETSSYSWRETMMFHVTLEGNAFSWIERDNIGRVKAIWQLNPERVRLLRIQGRLFYQYRYNDNKDLIDSHDIIHITGISKDGIIGLSLIEAIIKETGGIGIAAQEYAARWFANNASNGAVIEHPGTLGEDAQKRLKEQIRSEYTGLSNAHKVKILEEGMKLHELGGDPSSSQLLETRKFTVTEAARIWRIPPHMIADLDKATFSNIEQQSLEFTKYTMMPWFARWEQELNRKLIPKKDRGKYFFEFLIDGLLRADAQTRSEFYSKAFQNGWMSVNDIREKENMNPITGGDTYFVPLNLIPAASASEGNRSEKREEKRVSVRGRLRNAYKPIFVNEIKRIIRLESSEIKRSVKKYLNKSDNKSFADWLTDFYRNKFPDKIQPGVKRLFFDYASSIAEEAGKEIDSEWDNTKRDKFVSDYTESYIKKHAVTSRLQIEKIINKHAIAGSNANNEILSKVDKWEETRADTTANEHVVSLESAVSRAVFIAAGYKVIWVANSDACEICKALDGKIVGGEEPFIKAGSKLLIGDKEFSRDVNILHPSLHDGCECSLRYTI